MGDEPDKTKIHNNIYIKILDTRYYDIQIQFFKHCFYSDAVASTEKKHNDDVGHTAFFPSASWLHGFQSREKESLLLLQIYSNSMVL